MQTIPVKSAVVGTSNANTSIQSAPDLLRQAGMAALQNRAAYLPETTDEPLPAIAPKDRNPPCPPEAAIQLAWLVKHQQGRLQEIWVSKLSELNMSLPYEWIVPILQRGGSAYLQSAAALLELLGERGKWMAEQQESWNWIFKPNAFRSQLRRLEVEDSNTRVFQELRRQNPDEARLWLLRHWDELRHDGKRWQYLEALREGLNKADEVWLMNIAAGLHDGASDLLHEAQVALQLLSLLPKQAVVDDLCQKVFSTLHLAKDEKEILDFVWSVSYEGQLVYKAHIGLTNLMNIFDWRLSLDAILKLIPMSAWTGHFGIDPSGLLRSATHGTHRGVFEDAWGRRILFEANHDFAIAWLRNFGKLEEIGKKPAQYPDMLAFELFEMLSWEEIVVILADYIEDVD